MLALSRSRGGLAMTAVSAALCSSANSSSMVTRHKFTQVEPAADRVSYFYPLSSMVDAGQVLASAGQMKSGDTLYTIGEDDSILKALVMMKEKNAGALLVTHADVVSGIITERDYLTKVVVKGLCSRTSPVSAVMTKKVSCINSSASLDECLQVLAEGNFRHLPVVDSQPEVSPSGIKLADFAGVFSVRDILRCLKVMIDKTTHSVYSEEVSKHVDQSIESIISSTFVTVKPSDSVRTAVERMVTANIGRVAIIDDEGHLQGVLTEKDYRRKVILMDRESSTVTVDELMTTNDTMVVMTPKSTVRETVNAMVDLNIREIPVVVDRRNMNWDCVGFVCITDILQGKI